MEPEATFRRLWTEKFPDSPLPAPLDEALLYCLDCAQHGADLTRLLEFRLLLSDRRAERLRTELDQELFLGDFLRSCVDGRKAKRIPPTESLPCECSPVVIDVLNDQAPVPEAPSGDDRPAGESGVREGPAANGAAVTRVKVIRVKPFANMCDEDSCRRPRAEQLQPVQGGPPSPPQQTDVPASSQSPPSSSSELGGEQRKSSHPRPTPRRRVSLERKARVNPPEKAEVSAFDGCESAVESLARNSWKLGFVPDGSEVGGSNNGDDAAQPHLDPTEPCSPGRRADFPKNGLNPTEVLFRAGAPGMHMPYRSGKWDMPLDGGADSASDRVSCIFYREMPEDALSSEKERKRNPAPRKKYHYYEEIDSSFLHGNRDAVTAAEEEEDGGVRPVATTATSDIRDDAQGGLRPAAEGGTECEEDETGIYSPEKEKDDSDHSGQHIHDAVFVGLEDQEATAAEKDSSRDLKSGSESDSTVDSSDSEIVGGDDESLDKTSQLEKRHIAIKCFLDSEKTYLSILNDLVEFHGALSTLQKKLMNKIPCVHQKNSLNLQPFAGADEQHRNLFLKSAESQKSLFSKDDINMIFGSIETIQLHYKVFVDSLIPKVANWHADQTVGNIFKMLLVHYPDFENYTKNYSKARERIYKCCQVCPQFQEISKKIVLRATEERTSLEYLLLKPVNQLQQITSFLRELLDYTPKEHPDYKIIFKTWELTQHNLKHLDGHVDSYRAETDRYLLKTNYAVELVGSTRKLRCLFLFNDVLVCSKEKVRMKQTYDCRWFISLFQLTVQQDAECKQECKDSVQNIKMKISLLEEELEEGTTTKKISNKSAEKLKKKISEYKQDLALASSYLPFILKTNKKTYTLLMSSNYEREDWKEAIHYLKQKSPADVILTLSEIQHLVRSCKQVPKIDMLTSALDQKENSFRGMLRVVIHELTGLDELCDTYCCLEVDSYGHFFLKARTCVCKDSDRPIWNEEFELDLNFSQTLRILCYKKGEDNQEDILLGKSALQLSKNWLYDFQMQTISMNKISLVISIKHILPNKTLQRNHSKMKTGVFGVKIEKLTCREKRDIPMIITFCTLEIEKRGIHEIGIYRISGGTNEVNKLKQAFEKNSVGAKYLISDPACSIHSVAGILKLFFRELPEPLFTNALYKKFLDAVRIAEKKEREERIIALVQSLPDVNFRILVYLFGHLYRISQRSEENKMTVPNLAMIFGQSLMQPAVTENATDVDSRTEFLNAGLQNDVLQHMVLLHDRFIKDSTRNYLKAAVEVGDPLINTEELNRVFYAISEIHKTISDFVSALDAKLHS